MFIHTTVLNIRLQPASNSSFSQHKSYINVKFAMGCIQLNEKLVARLKIGLTAKQFWNESRWILRKRGPCCICHDDQVLHKILNFAARESNDRHIRLASG